MSATISKPRPAPSRVSSTLPKPRSQPAVPFWRTGTFRWSFASALLVWMSFPPCGLWWLAWCAPIGWVRVIRQDALEGTRPRLMLAGTLYCHWLLCTQWVRLPHWAAGIGWCFLAAYLTLYTLVFVLGAREIVQRTKISSVLVVPVLWVACEVARAYLFTGFALLLLGHTQVSVLPVAQLASVTGVYGVSFLIMFASAALERSLWPAAGTHRRVAWPLVVALGLVVIVAVWGQRQLSVNPALSARSIQVAIIQGDLDTEFGDNSQRQEEAFADYVTMTQRVVAKESVDLVIWPESMFSRYPRIEYDDAYAGDRVDPELPTWEEAQRLADERSALQLSWFPTACLLGTETARQTGPDRSTIARYNTAALYDADGEHRGSYHKMHPVMFGEYIPLGKWFPWIYRWTPISSGLTPGPGPQAFDVGGISLAPNICFENIVPQLIRQQLQQLKREGKTVDALVTLTNDGWFWGSSLLDLHLACGRYRAIEHRLPILIAANTGLSAHVDAHGRVLARGERRKQDVLLCRVNGSESGPTCYRRYGDVFGFLCCGLAVGFAATLVLRSRRRGDV